jgi:hypothetical protein
MRSSITSPTGSDGMVDGGMVGGGTEVVTLDGGMVGGGMVGTVNVGKVGNSGMSGGTWAPADDSVSPTVPVPTATSTTRRRFQTCIRPTSRTGR